MTDDPHHSSRALFRYSIVAQVIARMQAGEPPVVAIRTVAGREHVAFDGSARRISERSLYRWLAAFRRGGVVGLEPKGREAVSPSIVLHDDLVDFLVAEKRRDLRASVPELIRRARALGIVKPGQAVQRSTVYRTCKRLGLPLARSKRAKDRDARRFAYPHRMDMVLCDGKYFRVGERRNKRVVLFYLDDATRYPLHSVVGTTETTELFLRGLYECIVKHGYMSAVYLDRGPGFIAEDTIAVFARLEIPLLYGEVGYKEGRGKIERFNRTAKADLLRNLDGRPDIDPAYGALELRIRHYTDKVYAHRPHESLDGDTPWRRFHGDPRPLRFPEDRRSLQAKFEIWIERRVSADHVVSINSTDYETPRGYGGQKIVLRRRLLDGGIGFLHEGKIIDLHPVDLHRNARSPRARPDADRDPPQAVLPATAADLAFLHDFGPVVDGDGGVGSPDDDPPEDIPW
jgi:transposase InsO family protein